MNARLVRTPRAPDDWSISLLLEVHRDLFGDVFPEHAGRRRTREVTFRQHAIPKPEQIDYRLRQLVDEARAILDEAAQRPDAYEDVIVPRVATFHANCVVTQPLSTATSGGRACS